MIPEVYNKYDDIFENEKLKEIDTLTHCLKEEMREMKNIKTKKLNNFFKYCGIFVIKNKEIPIQETWGTGYKLNKSGFKQTHGYADRHSAYDYYECSYYIRKNDIEIFKPFLENINKEGQQIFNTIVNMSNPKLFKSKRIKLGTLQDYHMKHFYLPSYTKDKINYPINLIIDTHYGINIKIPAFHRGYISSLYCSDAESLKRQMLILEYYDTIKENLNLMINNIKEEYSKFQNDMEQFNKKIAKYELLLNL